jgi:hypothetical protein
MLLASSALLAFTANNDGASKTTKELSKSLVESFVAFNAADFALKGLGIASGSTAAAISTLIALGVGLSGFFRGINAEATKAAEEGMKKFGESFGLLTKGQQGAGIDAIKKLQKDLNDKQAALYETVIKQGRGGADFSSIQIKKGKEEEYRLLQKDLEWAARLLSEAEERVRQQKLLNDAMKEGALILRQAKTESPESINLKGTSPLTIADFIKQKGLLNVKRDELGGKIDAADQNAYRTERVKTNEEEILQIIEKQTRAEEERIRKQQEGLNILGSSVGTLQRAMDVFAISQESFIGTMIDGFNRILTVVEAINAVSQAISVISGLVSIASAPATGGLSLAGMLDIGSMVTGRRMSPSGGSSTSAVNIQYNVKANDARSFDQMMNSPAHQRAVYKAVAQAVRSMN